MHEQKDWLERALAGSETPIADAGFTLRIMQALPPRRQERGFDRNEWILMGGATIGAAAVAAQVPFAPFLNLLIESANTTWLAGLAVVVCMAGVLLIEPIRNNL